MFNFVIILYPNRIYQESTNDYWNKAKYDENNNRIYYNSKVFYLLKYN